MYKAFYNLKRNPFDITPDPSFLFPTKRHNEALAALYYGVRRRKGFVVLTGEVGTGKTLVLRCLLQLFRQNNDVAYAYIFNSRLSPVEFLQYIAADFGLPASGKNKSELLLELGNFVISRARQKLTTVLVVDEAHHLSAEILEEIRLLTNLETVHEKLLQILLVGQPELDDKLDSIGLRQLKQRIALRSHLEPLDVYQHSHGIPRLINTICENALIAAYARQMRAVGPDVIEEIATDFRLNVTHQTAERIPDAEDTEIRRAAQTLLDMYTYLQKPKSRESDLRASLSARLSKHEPYI